MLAIKLSEENMEKITECGIFDHEPPAKVFFWINQTSDWYLIHGYVPMRGEMIMFAYLPKFILSEYFDYNADKIDTDWVNLVRKE